MKKLESGQLFEIIANMAVVAGIIFLGIEIRQNTQSLEVNAYQSLVSQVNSFATLVIEKPELEMLARSNASLDELSDKQRLEVVGYFYFIARHGDLAFGDDLFVWFAATPGFFDQPAISDAPVLCGSQ